MMRLTGLTTSGCGIGIAFTCMDRLALLPQPSVCRHSPTVCKRIRVHACPGSSRCSTTTPFSRSRNTLKNDERYRRCARTGAAAPEVQPNVEFGTVLLPVLDMNPYLSDGTKQAISTAVGFGQDQNSKIIVLVLASTPQSPDDSRKRTETLNWHFQQSGFSNFEILENTTENASVTLGDIADQSGADMVVMSSEGVHAKVVDANLLAEFVPCPLLLLP